MRDAILLPARWQQNCIPHKKEERRLETNEIAHKFALTDVLYSIH